MNILLLSIPVIFGVLVIACIWGLVVNEITCKQRNIIIKAMTPGHPRFRHLHRLYEQVSYYEHHWCLFFFRSPWRLYHPDILDAVRALKREDA